MPRHGCQGNSAVITVIFSARTLAAIQKRRNSPERFLLSLQAEHSAVKITGSTAKCAVTVFLTH